MYRVIKAARTEPLYHGTTCKNAISILETNELRANISNETETYGISFTRRKEQAYDEVSLVIDQEKITHNYKIDPVYRDGIAGKDLAEERVPRTIKNIRDYIIEIRLNASNRYKNFKINKLRRDIINYGQDYDLLKVDKVPDKRYSRSNKICIVKRFYDLIRTCDKYNIPIDEGLEEIWKYIQMYIDGVEDTESIELEEAKQRRKSERRK